MNEMKNAWITILCSVCLWSACTEEVVPSIYTGPDGINFYYDQVGPYDADPYPGGSSVQSGSLSNSSPRDTLWFRILVMGNLSDKERSFSLKQSTLSAIDSSSYYTGGVKVAVPGVNYIAFDDPEMQKYYVIPPAVSYVDVPVIMMRDPEAFVGSSKFSMQYCLHFGIVPTDELKILDPRFYRAKLTFTQWSW